MFFTIHLSSQSQILLPYTHGILLKILVMVDERSYAPGRRTECDVFAAHILCGPKKEFRSLELAGLIEIPRMVRVL